MCVCVCVCMCVCVCVCVNFVMCGFCNVCVCGGWVSSCMAVFAICVPVFITFCIFCTVFFVVSFMYVYCAAAPE
jgi:hypothetical protein